MTDYRLGSGVRWLVERFSIKLTDGKGASRTLSYPEAAIWDLFARGYDFAHVVSMMRHIASLDSRAADRLVRAALEDWAESGFIERG